MGEILTVSSRATINFRIKMLTLLLSTAAAVFVAEWSIRLALPEYDPSGHIVWERHPKAGTVLGRPGAAARQIKNSGDYDVSVRFNRYGFRDRQDVATGNHRDVYVVGDSFTFGWGVEENLRFSNRLATHSGQRIFNLSAPLNIDSYASLIKYAESLGAEIRDIVIAINMIDDFVIIKKKIKERPIEEPQTTGRDIVLTFKSKLLTNSALYFALTTSLKSSIWLNALLKKLGLIRALKDSVWGAPPENAVSDSIRALVQIAKNYNLTLMLIPSRGLWQGDKVNELSAYHEQVRKDLISAGLQVVDLRPVMEKTGAPLNFHFRNDGHWNPAGHAIAAETLSRYLVRVR